MKNLATKLFAVIFIIMLAAGCASSITAPSQDLQPEQQETKIEAPDNIGGTSDMEGSRERPKL